MDYLPIRRMVAGIVVAASVVLTSCSTSPEDPQPGSTGNEQLAPQEHPATSQAGDGYRSAEMINNARYFSEGKVRDQVYERTVFPKPTAGGSMRGVAADGDTKDCTISFFATDQKGRDQMVLPATCLKDDETTRVEVYTDLEGATKDFGLPSEVHFEKFTFGETDPKESGHYYATVPVPKGMSYEPKIAGIYDIVGVAKPADLVQSIEVCKFGAVTHETCYDMAPNIGMLSQPMLALDLDAVEGDFGAPVYIKVGGNQVMLVGFVVLTDEEPHDDGFGLRLFNTYVQPAWTLLHRSDLDLNGQKGYLHS